MRIRSDTFVLHRINTANHATSFVLSDARSNRRGARFAQRKLRKALRQARRGNLDRALGTLGRALHAAEDVIAHRGLGNLTETVVQHLATGGNGQRMATHGRQDASLNVTKTDDPTTGVVTGVNDQAAHDEILDSLDDVVGAFLAGISEQQRRAISE